MAKLLLSNSLLRTLGQELLVAELVKQAGHLRWKPWAEKGTHRLPESSCQPNLTASPQHLPHPSRVPSKPLLQTTQDFAFLSARYGLENQKELKLLFLLFSQEGHGLKLGAVTMTMNTLALSTKAPRSWSSEVPRTSQPPRGQGQMNPNLTDAQKINPQSPGSLANPNPTSLRGLCQSNPFVHEAS